MKRKTLLMILAMTIAVAIFCVLKEQAYSTPQKAPEPSEQELASIAMEAYIYGYPLVTMEVTRRVSTNVTKPEGTKAPMGTFAKLRNYPPADDHTVTAPNADTLYTITWLDVSKEPWILTIPDMNDRYYLMPMLSAWTDVFQAPGKRTTGTKAQKYAIIGPGWTGKVPKGVTEYKSPTGIVWIIGRIYCTGTPEDYGVVHALQDKFSVTPLSAYGKSYKPPESKVDPNIDMKTAVRNQVHAMDAASYFKLLAELLKTNPPSSADAAMIAKLAKVGIVPGEDFEMSKADPSVAKALQTTPKIAQEKIMAELKNLGTPVNGWTYSTKLGVYGTDYLVRALVTAIGLGANRPQDAIYPTSVTDADGRPYDGANKYVMHFDKGQMPPVRAFWSVTMYDPDYFFVKNKLNRYTLSQRNTFRRNKDGSVDLYIQNTSPGKDKEANWLPAPAGHFILMLRLYWPKEKPPSILDGSWKPPVVKMMQ
jgi:hypothetical protein